MKTYHCRDAGFDCEKVISGNDEEHILELAATHALEVHGMEPTEQMRRDMRRLIINDSSNESEEIKINL